MKVAILRAGGAQRTRIHDPHQVGLAGSGLLLHTEPRGPYTQQCFPTKTFQNNHQGNFSKLFPLLGARTYSPGALGPARREAEEYHRNPGAGCAELRLKEVQVRLDCRLPAHSPV